MPELVWAHCSILTRPRWVFGGKSFILRLRVIAPLGLVAKTVEVLDSSPVTVNLAHLCNAARAAHGALLMYEVAREDASGLLAEPKGICVHHAGSFTVDPATVEISDEIDQPGRSSRSTPVDAVRWQEIEQRISAETRLTPTFVIFMAVPTMTAGIGVLYDQPTLLVGAMIVEPDFSPLAALSVGVFC